MSRAEELARKLNNGESSGLWYQSCDAADELRRIAAENAQLKAELEAIYSTEPVAWKHDCAALLQNDVELWVARCPHCGKPKTNHQQQASNPITDGLELVLEALVNRCNNDAGLTNDDAVIAAEAALERLYRSRAAIPLPVRKS